MRCLSGMTAILACFALGSTVSADTFGTGSNQFSIDFVTISGGSNPTSGYGIVRNDYRMGVFEITNGQFSKFTTENDPYYKGDKVPATKVSWYEAAKFVNWLNTSTGHHAAYNFTDNGSFDVWTESEAAGGTNLYRHKDAYYFLPTENEWVKAAYWNGTSLQQYATKADESLTQGDGTSGTGWNYHADDYATDPPGPWNVGSGSEELNGTRDMMGNVWEWMESPDSGQYSPSSLRVLRGGSHVTVSNDLQSSYRLNLSPTSEYGGIGFRVASSAAVPEPGSVPGIVPGRRRTGPGRGE